MISLSAHLRIGIELESLAVVAEDMEAQNWVVNERELDVVAVTVHVSRVVAHDRSVL